MDFIIANQELIVTVGSLVIAWLIALIWKKSADKTQIAAALTMILDIVQDIANNPDTRNLENFQKKDLAIAKVEAALPPPKKNLVKKVFGSVGGAVEFVWKNRKWLFSAAGKLIKVVF